MGKKRKYRKRVAIRHNLDGSITTTETRTRKTIFGTTYTETYSWRTGGTKNYRNADLSRNQEVFTSSRDNTKKKEMGCGTSLFIIGLIAFPSIAFVYFLIVEIINHNSPLHNLPKEVFIGFVAVLTLYIILRAIAKRRLQNNNKRSSERKKEENFDVVELMKLSNLLNKSSTDEIKQAPVNLEKVEPVENKKIKEMQLQIEKDLDAWRHPEKSDNNYQVDNHEEASMVSDQPDQNKNEVNNDEETSTVSDQPDQNKNEVNDHEEASSVNDQADENEDIYIPYPYYAPPVTDLYRSQSNIEIGSEEISRKIEEILIGFGVNARVIYITHGPAMTRYELELAPGTRINKIISLKKDLMNRIPSKEVYLEAPIAGKSLVGISLPNNHREIVPLRDLLPHNESKDANSNITVPLGKDRLGTPVLCDLSLVSHLLIAGQDKHEIATFINTIITSLLYSVSPDEVKFVLINPNGAEFNRFNGIPHLLIPAVNGIGNIVSILAWIVSEMERRSILMSRKNVKDIAAYNLSRDATDIPIYNLIVIINVTQDIIANLYVMYALEKIAAKGVFSGIHLIISAHSLLPENVSGVLRGIPGRISFRTASHDESYMKLDLPGAEKLTGCGDMLYLPKGQTDPIWIQGCSLSNEELSKVLDHVRFANPYEHDKNVLNQIEVISKAVNVHESLNSQPQTSSEEGDNIQLLIQAIEIAVAEKEISASILMRRIKIGYSKAGKIIDEMEKAGIISSKDQSKPRKCLISNDTWEKFKTINLK